MQTRYFKFAASVISIACASTVFAAEPIDLSKQPASVLQSFAGSQVAVKQISKDTDFNHVTHARIQQTYMGYPVWGSDAVVHTPNTSSNGLGVTMNGVMYQGLTADLAHTPAYVFTSAQADKALQQATLLYQKKSGIKSSVQQAKKYLMVYVDKNHKAHWAFFVSFFTGNAVPTYILDAASLDVLDQWNDLQTLNDVTGGGFGGNEKTGKLSYDGVGNDLPSLKMQRDASKQLCYLQNKDVLVKDNNAPTKNPFDNALATFKCSAADKDHNQLYWDGEEDNTNGGFSPANDALYIGQIIQEMYQSWYHIPALSFFGFPMMLKMHVHVKNPQTNEAFDNAFFLSLNSEMYFGDGLKYFYPLTSLGVGAHEISHGFTSQHSALVYTTQSGGLNEAFSDMAAQAAEFFAYGHNSWQIGPEIVKGEGALRYMDDPTKDGKSIGHMKDYNDSLNVHYTSGIFNKVFYLLGTASGWNTQKAFNVMVKANMNYWTSTTTFADAACGVIKAARDYRYDVTAVNAAFDNVGLDVLKC